MTAAGYFTSMLLDSPCSTVRTLFLDSNDLFNASEARAFDPDPFFLQPASFAARVPIPLPAASPMLPTPPSKPEPNSETSTSTQSYASQCSGSTLKGSRCTHNGCILVGNELYCKRHHSAMIKETETCSICLDSLNCGKTVTLGCNHQFHLGCLQSWKTSTCPNCRAPYDQSTGVKVMGATILKKISPIFDLPTEAQTNVNGVIHNTLVLAKEDSRLADLLCDVSHQMAQAMQRASYSRVMEAANAFFDTLGVESQEYFTDGDDTSDDESDPMYIA